MFKHKYKFALSVALCMRSETAFHSKGEWTYHEINNIKSFVIFFRNLY